MKKPFTVRYNAYTESIEVLDNADSVCARLCGARVWRSLILGSCGTSRSRSRLTYRRSPMPSLRTPSSLYCCCGVFCAWSCMSDLHDDDIDADGNGADMQLCPQCHATLVRPCMLPCFHTVCAAHITSVPGAQGVECPICRLDDCQGSPRSTRAQEAVCRKRCAAGSVH